MGKALFFLLTLLMVTSIIFTISDYGFAASEISGLVKKILPNGLTAIVKESHRAPVVAVQVWVKAGSAYETPKQAGITHLIEHMIFKGTEKRGAGELASIIESLGGTINAYTSYDYTVYHCVVPRDKLDIALDVLDDAVFHSTFDPEELEREKKVVLEEMSMRLDNPHTRLYEELMKISYKVYPYNRPIIGYKDTVMSFTRQDILAYIEEYYRPCNMSVIVVGDVDGEEALSAIDRYFGREKAEECQEHQFPQEPPQEAPRTVQLKMDCSEGYLAMSFSGLPGFDSEDTPALDLLSTYLSDGESSLLVSRLKNQMQLVHSISTSAFTPRGPGLFEITADIDPDKVRQVLVNTLAQLFRLRQQQVSAKEIQRAKTQLVTDFIYSQETMEGEARKLGVFQTLAGDPNKELAYINQVQSLTGDDLLRICNKYFDPKRINLSLVFPKDSPIKISDSQLVEIIQEAEAKAQGLGSLEGAKAVSGNARRFTLANGVTLICQEAKDLPTVGIRVVLPGGLRYETPKDNGIFNMLAMAWTKGTKFHNASALSEIIDGMGAEIRGFSGQNSFGLRAKFTSQHLKKGLALLTEILLNPSFPEGEVDKLKPQILAKIRQQDDYIPAVAIREFKKLLFSPHPYGMNLLGTPETVMAFSSQDLKQIYTDYVVPDRAIIAVVGDIDTQQIRQELEALLQNWQNNSSLFLPTPPDPRPFTGPRVTTIHRERQQDNIVLGFMGPGILNKDRFALEVMNAILAGQGGRLFKELRDKESLAYSVTSFVNFGIDYGLIATYIACAPQKKKDAQKGLWKELYRIQDEPVSSEELERAKNWLIGRYQISLQTPGAKAMDMALNELYGLGFDFSAKYPGLIRAITPQDISSVAKRYFNPEAYVLVTVGP